MAQRFVPGAGDIDRLEFSPLAGHSQTRHEQVGHRAVLTDQVKNPDWKARKAMPKGKTSAEELDEVRANISSLLGVS